MTPGDAQGGDLAEVLRRLAPRIEALFRRFGVSPDEAAPILDAAALEVQLRCSRRPDMEGRLLRAVERGCEALLAERRRQALAALTESTEASTETAGEDDRGDDERRPP